MKYAQLESVGIAIKKETEMKVFKDVRKKSQKRHQTSTRLNVEVL